MTRDHTIHLTIEVTNKYDINDNDLHELIKKRLDYHKGGIRMKLSRFDGGVTMIH